MNPEQTVNPVTPPPETPKATVPESISLQPAFVSVTPPTQVVFEPVIPDYLPKSRWKRILHWEHMGLLLILAVTLVFHFLAIERPTTIVWDEVWYVGDARAIMSGNGDLRPEHPPLAKLLIVAGQYVFNGFKVPEDITGGTNVQAITGSDQDTTIYVSDSSLFTTGQTIRIEAEQMDIQSVDIMQNFITVKRGAGGSTIAFHNENQSVYVFTDNAFGWRFFAVVFGTISIILFYFICRKLKMSWKAVMIATFLFAFDDMTFIHSGLALLDVYMVTFMLAGILLYLHEGYLLAGIAIALATLCKLAGAMIFIALILHFLIYRRKDWRMFASSLIVAAVSFVFFLVIFDFVIYGSLENPITRLTGMLSGTAINDFTVPKLSISSRPWTWIYPQFVQFYYNSPNVPFIIYSYDPQYVSFVSTTIQILIIPTLGYLLFKAGEGSKMAAFALLWFLATYIAWIPLDIASNRVTFVFYFLPTIPVFCIGIAMGLSEAIDRLRARVQKLGRVTVGSEIAYAGIGMYLFLHFLIFFIFNPAMITLIKTWESPFSIGVDPTPGALPLLFFSSIPASRWIRSKIRIFKV